MTEHLKVSVENHIGRITLNRPEALNALTLPMIQVMQAQLDAWALDDGVYAVVVDAVAGRAFCAGGDVRSLYALGRDDISKAMSFFWHEYRLNATIYHYTKPYIVLMDGITMGGGVGVSLHGKYPIASERFIFAMPETTIGFFPDIGASYLLSRCKDLVGLYLGLTGARLKAAEALRLDLVYAFAPHESFELILKDMMKVDLSQDAHKKVEAMIARYHVQPDETDDALRYSEIEASFNQPNVLAIMQSVRQNTDPWAIETHQNLLNKSPMSLCVTYQLLHRAKTKTLNECLSMDYAVAYHFLKSTDFYEGVRALLIDKDNTPHWQPALLENVSIDRVNAFFDMPNMIPALFV